MISFRGSIVLFIFLALAPSIGRAEETAVADEVAGLGPRLAHVPVLQVLRGQPVTIVTEINSNQYPVKEATLFVKLTEVQKPFEYPMQGGSSNLWQATIPAGVLLLVDHFWYYIHATDTEGQISDTPWMPVSIVARLGEGLAGAALADQGAGGGGFFSGSGPWWVGGALLLGGGAAIVEHNSGGGGGGGGTPPAADSPKTPAQTTNNNGGGGGGGGDEDDSEAPCVLTGSERVLYNNLSPFGKEGGFPIEIVVCGACPNARIVVIGSWGDTDSQDNYNNPTCSTTDPGVILTLEKPDGFDGCESESIIVLSNGQVIDTIPWPDCDEF